MAVSKVKGTGVHWKAPTTLVAAFLVGIILAIGHHLFYKSLDGTPINQTSLSQETNAAIGTALAFLVRSALVLAVATAFIQMLWWNLRSEALPVSTIDSLASLPHALQEFFLAPRVWRHPVLVLLAALSWTLPFAAVFPPATLTVRNEAFVNNSMQLVPALDFSKRTFGAVTTSETQFANQKRSMSQGAPHGMSRLLTTRYGGPTQSLLRLVMGTTVQGSLPLRAPLAPNSSFTMEFFGPSVQCQPSPASIMNDINAVLGCKTDEPLKFSGNVVAATCFVAGESSAAQGSFPYISWTPSNSSLVPFPSRNIDGSIKFPTLSATTTQGVKGNLSSYLGGYEDGPASLFMAIRPDIVRGEWSVLSCSLYNSSYNININSENNIGAIKVNSITTHHPVPANLILGQMKPNDSMAITRSTEAPYDKAQVSYQAIMESFGRLLVGLVEFTYSDDAQLQPDGRLKAQSEAVVIDSTSFLSTNLAQSDEMAPLLQYMGTLGNGPNITINPIGPLSDLVEQLFQNITLGLFSNDFFVTSVEEGVMANVTISTMQIVYLYRWKFLVLSYGIAILFTLAALIVGCVAIYANGASYSDKFSTLMRATRDIELPTLGTEDFQKGADPLPKLIRNTRVALGARDTASLTEGSSRSSLSAVKGGAVTSETTAMIAQDEQREMRRTNDEFSNSR